jgi:arginine-tRNA-protein transferase
VVSNDFTLDVHHYSALIAQGFRRSGDQVYTPFCQNCKACVPTRLEPKTFQPNRQQKRCLKQNSQTRVVVKPAGFDAEHFALYQRYQTARHTTIDSPPISIDEYLLFLTSTWCKTWFVEFWISDKLTAVAVVDVLDNALSAVYTFFDPEFSSYSPGVYAVLWQILQAQQLQLDCVYLGFWIKDCQKMKYKNQYQPLMGLIDQQWQLIPNSK